MVNADLSSQRFRLGTFFGIDLFVHWTFGLLIAYVVYLSWDYGREMITFAVAQLLAVFLCVTLHEYGHALAARRYGVGTHDITLLPIGGVARLNRIPRVASQEFVIAIAGPAVNVVIALLLGGVLFVVSEGELFEPILAIAFEEAPAESMAEVDPQSSREFASPTGLDFVRSILLINVMLIVFNMIPAFPMDGGRVLRSLLAMVMPYLRATRWAQRIGMLCAVLMAAFALSNNPPYFVMVLIAGFIVFAGLTEVRQVELRDAVEGLRVGDVMTTRAPAVRADMSVDELWRWWQSEPSATAAVVGVDNILLGLVRLQDLGAFLKRFAAEGGRISPTSPTGLADASPTDLTPYSPRPAAPASVSRFGSRASALDFADTRAPAVNPNQPLESVLGGGRNSPREFAVVDSLGRLVGWLSLDSVLDRAAIARVLPTPRGDESGPNRDEHGPLIDHHA